MFQKNAFTKILRQAIIVVVNVSREMVILLQLITDKDFSDYLAEQKWYLNLHKSI